MISRKTIKMFGLLFCTILMCIGFTACGDDEDGVSTADIVGSWYGTNSYYNPVSGTKYSYLTITFESNGTGSLEHESPSVSSVARFTYRIQGNTIFCVGAYANSNGDVEDDFAIRISIEGNRLVPLERFNQFILTRGDSYD